MLGRLLRSLRASSAARANDYGLRAWQAGQLLLAERHLRRAIDADPRFAPAFGNLGMVLWEQQRRDEGLQMLRDGIALDETHAGLRVNLANALVMGGHLQEGVEHYRQVLRCHPEDAGARTNLLKPLLDLCDWRAAEAHVTALVAQWEAGDMRALDALTPFLTLLIELPAAMRLAVAQQHALQLARNATPLPRRASVPAASSRLRIGYLSSDFHHHATAALASGLFERHDRERFEVHAFSFGPDDGSPQRHRLEVAFEHFHDCRALSHRDLARCIAAERIDVLVDLKGYTGGSRPEVLALRPAPIQVSYLGYPGSMGAPFIDYIIADPVLIPARARAWYTEQVVYLPGSYQVNDDRQGRPAPPPARAACGLPDDAFVFACFNEHHKIDRRVMNSWLSILRAAPRGVLWLLQGHGESALRQHIASAGVDPARVVFAPRLPRAHHLARHACADLCLDTFTYNAHTTASDALWAGLPMITLAGESFAARVGSSLLMAVSLPETIATSTLDYETAAVALASDPAALQAMRARLVHSRDAAGGLFDTASTTRQLERAYVAMRDAHLSGAPLSDIRL